LKLLAIVALMIVTLGGVGSYVTFFWQPGTNMVISKTTTAQQLYKLNVHLFFDKNGDGIQQPGEPPLANATGRPCVDHKQSVTLCYQIAMWQSER
jgi:hypothetical protein